MDLSDIIIFIYLIGCLTMIYLCVKLNRYVVKKITFNDESE